MEDLRVTLIQSSLHWENVAANLNLFDEKIASIPLNSTDLIVLPELFNTGFTMNAAACFEEMNGVTHQWMLSNAKANNCVIIGSLIIKEDGKFYNRLIWARPDGSYEVYNKRHLFRMAKEDETFTGGTEKLIVELKGWNICPMICYDLRFPVWCRNRKEYDVLIFVANWPQRRAFAWKHLLIARAIENQSFVIGVNRIGEDGNGMIHSGDSAAIDFMGAEISSIIPNQNAIETVTLSYHQLKEFRTQFPAAMDADEFDIH